MQIQYRNARYQGPVSGSTMLRHGLGLLLDDNGNIFLSDFHLNHLNHHSYIHLVSHNLKIYGVWLHDKPHGLNIIEHKDLRMIGMYRNGKIGKTIVLEDRANEVVHIMENRGRYEDDFEVVNRVEGKGRAQEILAWLVGSQANVGRLWSSPAEYVRMLVQGGQEGKNNKRRLCFVESEQKNYLGWMYNGNRQGLGVVLTKSMEAQTIGCYNSSSELQGICSSCRGQNLTHGIVTQGVLEVLPPNVFLKQHMKAINFVNECVYFLTLQKLREQFAIMFRTVTRFEKGRDKEKEFIDSLEKLSVGDKSYKSQKSDDMQYSRKYYDEEYSNKKDIKIIVFNQKDNSIDADTQTPNRKPGFIKRKSPDITPEVSPHVSPSPKNFEESNRLENSISKTKKQLFQYFSKTSNTTTKHVLHKNQQSAKTIVKVSVRGQKSKSKSQGKTKRL